MFLVESIKFENGSYFNLEHHNHRLNDALSNLFGRKSGIKIESILENVNAPQSGLYKCRVVYSRDSFDVEFVPYTMSDVKYVKILEDDEIKYDFKYADRERIDDLYNQRGNCDDIMIVKKGLISDSSSANIIFRHGNDWFTPSSPLLKGVRRKELLEKKVIVEKDISLNQLKNYESFKLINAMRAFDSQEIDVSNIVF